MTYDCPKVRELEQAQEKLNTAVGRLGVERIELAAARRKIDILAAEIAVLRSPPPAEPPRQVVWAMIEGEGDGRMVKFVKSDGQIPTIRSTSIQADLQEWLNEIGLNVEVKMFKPATCPHGRELCPDCQREAGQ
jgi:hypothetical protein